MKIIYYIVDERITVDQEIDFIEIKVNGSKFILQQTPHSGELRIEKRKDDLNMTIKGHNYILIK